MSYSPLCRWRNFTVENLKSVIALYPDMHEIGLRTSVVDDITKSLGAYKSTAYQFACQLGLETRANNFTQNNYLHFLSDTGLRLYMDFWFKMYVAPNPYVKSDAPPICPFLEMAKAVLSSSTKHISYAAFCQEYFGDTANLDIFTNALLAWGAPLVLTGDTLSISTEDEETLRNLIEKVESTLPMHNCKDEEEFFARFSCERFLAYHGKSSWDDIVSQPTGATPSGTTAKPISPKSGLSCAMPRNRIFFGAPGTGKSYTLNQEKDALLSQGGDYERVTFHPDYSYANFVGTYKPVPQMETNTITYEYVPGPFMRILTKALANCQTNTPKPFLLIIEEINRANVAAVFGEIFQLLDRADDAVSEYPIQASEDVKNYLAKALGGLPDDFSELRIPDNLFLWATMNSADQGVFPMDTAFKRRWDFTYLGIDDSDAGIVGKKVVLGQGEYRRIVEWNALRRAINKVLLTYKVNEDKLMGPYFISKQNLPEDDTIDPAAFTRIFKNKVIMYLFDDAAKQKRPSLFAGCLDENKNLYSQICREFDTKGVFIFCTQISDCFLPKDDGE